YGLAWHVPSQQLFTASYVKKSAGLGPDGNGGTTTGGIYVLNALADNTANATLFSDLNAAVGTGNDPHPDSAAVCGSLLLLENSNRSCWTHDSATPAQVGKIGLGDIDFSPDYKTLFAVNLNNRSLIGIEVGVTATAVLTNPVEYNYTGNYADCNGGDWRPFALGRHNGDMFLGVTCSAETSLDNSNLDAIIYKFDPAAPATLNRVARFDLDYTRAGQITDCSGADTGFSADCPATWQPWSDSIDINNVATSQIKYITRDSNSAVEIVYPQPMVSDIEFSGNDMLIGIRDRSADQFGYLTGSHLSPLDTRPWSAFSAGETLCASYNETTGMFQYDHEFNGICGIHVNAFTHLNEGIGGDEFFNDNNINLGSGFYEELNAGSVAAIPGKDQIVTSLWNPTSNIAASGLGFYNMFNGSADGGVQFCAAPANATAYSFAGGISDVEALCIAAPIEIGNYVWEDSNGNGVQDVDENGISGLNVTLTCGSFTTTTTTDADGHYYFNSNTNATFLVANQACTLSFPTTHDNGTATLVPTRQNAGVNDFHDSDASKGGIIELTTPETGSANHNYDIGYSVEFTDWGDLPDSFGTLLASDGARHIIDDALYLGSCIDDESNGNPDSFAGASLAGGDDATAGVAYADCANGDDEDGVTLLTSLIPGAEACVSVTAKNTTGSTAVLQAWIDFDGDNSFAGDPNEEIVFTDATVQNGTTISEYCFQVPSADQIDGEAYKGGDVHMRFRLSQAGGLSYNGPAPEGEVEDYYTPLACIGSYIWIDWDEDGSQNEDLDASVAGTTVSLYFYG
ncbi:MAG TPA: hypothetical protein ENJ56_03725, partial [Anaerolineae bacterium]|nr:hypothetical protein [Anaerolineae bacterium]